MSRTKWRRNTLKWKSHLIRKRTIKPIIIQFYHDERFRLLFYFQRSIKWIQIYVLRSAHNWINIIHPNLMLIHQDVYVCQTSPLFLVILSKCLGIRSKFWRLASFKDTPNVLHIPSLPTDSYVHHPGTPHLRTIFKHILSND